MSDAKQELLKNKRLVIIDQIDRLNAFFDNEDSVNSASVEALQIRLRTLDRVFANFDKIQGTIEERGYHPEAARIRAEVEEIYFRLNPEITHLINTRQAKLARPRVSIASGSADGANTSQAQINDSPCRGLRLPDLSVPTFSGDSTKWVSFNETFTSLIHNNNALTNSTKFQYLMLYLAGPAARIVESIEINDENYDVAIRLLCERYDNRKLIAQEHIRKIFDTKQVEKNSIKDLRDLIDSTRAHLRALENLKRPTKHWDDLLVHMLSTKLDAITLSKWQETSSADRLPTIEELFSFLNKRCQVLENTSSPAHASSRPTSSTTNTNRPRPTSSLSANLPQQNLPPTKCIYCNSENHLIYRCDRFKKLYISNRIAEIKKKRACLNCLRSGHLLDSCPTEEGCRTCSAKHHTLLHLPTKSESTIPVRSDKLQSSSTSSSSVTRPTTNTSLQSTSSAAQGTCEYTFLSTAIINILDGRNNTQTCRALLDSGSQINFITEQTVKQFGLPKSRVNTSVSGVAGHDTVIKYKTIITISSRIHTYSATLEAYILPKITGQQPNQYIDSKSWKVPENIQLADPQYFEPQKIDILIGAELVFELLLVGQIKSKHGRPTLQNTILGWVLAGKSQVPDASQCSFVVSSQQSLSLDKQIQQFWELEQISNPSIKSAEEEDCERHYSENIRRTTNGQYIVSLPFKIDPTTLGNSRQIATRRFYKIEQKLQKNDELRAQYTAFMSEYLSLGHMERIDESVVPESNYFLPHHCVLKPDSSTTKLRVVFDASAKSSSSHSLNDILMTGPTVQSEIFSVIIRFRLWQYGFTTDIAKMYRQILVNEPDQNYQLIVWRDKPTDQLNVYRLKTITYGTSAAPFLATRTLNQIAIDHAEQYPLASTALQRDCYVDDIITGSDSLEEVIQIKKELIQMLQTSGIELKKWCANDQRIIQDLPASDLEKHMCIRDNDVIKTLGLIWEPNNDQFLINIQPNDTSIITKRTILAATMRIFDPFGLIAPVVITAKILIQQLWKLGIAWDAALPQNLHTSWLEYSNSLQHLNELKINRRVLLPNATEIQIHAFADASEKAYGSCIYLRSTNWNDDVHVSLLCAKSRVAPTASTSLPRLELCAAQLTAQLVHKVLEIVPIKIGKICYYSDSTITLAWIAQPAYKWKTFVSNRVANIQELSDPNSWYHVPTDQNPADLTSRGLSPKRLTQSSLWFNGPEFLWDVNLNPSRIDLAACDTAVPESKFQVTSLVSSTHTSSDFIESLKFKNSYIQTVRIIAYCRRFINNSRASRTHQDKNTGVLTTDEIEDSLMTCVKIVQSSHYSEEISLLSKNRVISRGSSLSSLTPFLDCNGILRVGGRLQNADIPFAAKHPILLPNAHTFSHALMSHHHIKNLHAGAQSLLSIVRQRFWPLRGKELARKIVRRCIRCVRTKPKTISQLMGELPVDRVIQNRPFATTGVDFLGPIHTHIKLRGARPTKSYVALFVCFSTKALHMEAVSDLSSDAFIAALKRFIGRRGLPQKLYTDNATNFVGAKNDLREFAEMFQSQATQNKIKQFLANEGIEWHNIPPRSPHFGGLWEAGVKSAKFHLRRQLATASLTYEELCTIIVQIEAILNSRPLTPLTSDPNDLSALTAGHFLIGAPLTSIIEPNITQAKITNISRFRQISWLQQRFWQRWSKEYLHTLQARTKWQKKETNISVNSLVLLEEDNLPPMQWRLGRITELHTGRDGLVRVVTVKTSTGYLKRAVTRLAVLPVEN